LFLKVRRKHKKVWNSAGANHTSDRSSLLVYGNHVWLPTVSYTIWLEWTSFI